MKNYCGKLQPVSFGLAWGVSYGFALFLTSVFAVYHYVMAEEIMRLMSTFYTNYEPTFLGSATIGMKAFLCHFIGGFVVAWLYNVFSCAGSCLCKKEEKTKR